MFLSGLSSERTLRPFVILASCIFSQEEGDTSQGRKKPRFFGTPHPQHHDTTSAVRAPIYKEWKQITRNHGRKGFLNRPGPGVLSRLSVRASRGHRMLFISRHISAVIGENPPQPAVISIQKSRRVFCGLSPCLLTYVHLRCIPCV